MRVFRIALLARNVQGLALAQQDNRPKILFLLADDHRPDAVGASDNPRVRTPHIGSRA